MRSSGKAEKEKNNVPLLETKDPTAVVKKLGLVRKIAFCGAGALVIVLAVMLVIRLSSGKGEKQARKLSEYLGTSVGTAEDKLDIHLKDNSSYSIINRADTFDYVYESEDNVSIDDIKFPEWTVTVIKTPSEKIDSVIYTDYEQLKSDSRGKLLDKRPDLDVYGRSTKIGTVLDEVDADPFRITYEADSTRYEFRYRYELDNGDVQSMALIITADNEGRYFYSTSEELDPFFITSKAPSARSAG